jgi:hypothetical protein
MAEGVGFEPTEACASRAFQARRFGRSRTPPNHQRVAKQRVNDGRLSEESEVITGYLAGLHHR